MVSRRALMAGSLSLVATRDLAGKLIRFARRDELGFSE